MLKIISERRKEKIAQKREFNKKLNELFAKKYRYSLRYEDSLIGEDGKAHVNVDLTKLDTPFSVFSYGKRMDPEIFDYIDQSVFYLRVEIPVVINFDEGGKYDEDLKDKIRKAVIRHYSLNYEDKRIEHKKHIRLGLILALVGIIFLVGHFFIRAYSTPNDIFDEITLILSWMFIWTSVDTFLVSGHDKRVDIKNAGQLALAEITFDKH